MSKVWYNGKFYNLVPTVRSSQTHYLVEGGKKIQKEQCILCEFSENDIVRYGENAKLYGKIVGKTPFYQQGMLVYHVWNLLKDEPKNTDNFNETELENATKVRQNDIRGIPKADWHDIVTAAKHTRQYNRVVKTKLINLDFVIDTLKRNFKLRSNCLSELSLRIKITKSDLDIEKIVDNPYLFIQEEWQLFNFDKAFYIEEVLGLEINANQKLKAWIYSLIHSKNSFYYSEKDFDIDYEENQFRIYKDSRVITRQQMIDSEILVSKIIEQCKYITTPYLLKYEKSLGDKTIRLYHETPLSNVTVTNAEIDYYIEMFTREVDGRITLNEEQRHAVRNSFTKKLSIITGFPGTGKSTIVECILYIRNELGLSKNYSITAPTGLAYNNMCRKLKHFDLNLTASGTLHRVIYSALPYIYDKSKKDTLSDTNSNSDIDDEDDKLESVDVMIVDEVSMMDIFMCNHLLNWAEKLDFQLILIGDSNQLQSVGPGKVLHSIIESRLFDENIVALTKICRQDDGALLTTIKKMASGEIARKRDFDNISLLFREIRYFKNDDNSLNPEKIMKLNQQYSLTKKDTKYLCYNSSTNNPINVTSLNRVLQSEFNPSENCIPCSSDKPIAYKVKDRIILKSNETQTKKKRRGRGMNVDLDQYVEDMDEYISMEVYRANGDEAIILSYDEEKKTVNISYMYDEDGGWETIISIKELYELYDLSYALTVHKSQGSQSENIVLVIDNIYNLSKPVIFTGISRAQKRCFVICNGETDFITIQQKDENKTSLFLKEFIETEFEVL